MMILRVGSGRTSPSLRPPRSRSTASRPGETVPARHLAVLAAAVDRRRGGGRGPGHPGAHPAPASPDHLVPPSPRSCSARPSRRLAPAGAPCCHRQHGFPGPAQCRGALVVRRRAGQPAPLESWMPVPFTGCRARVFRLASRTDLASGNGSAIFAAIDVDALGSSAIAGARPPRLALRARRSSTVPGPGTAVFTSAEVDQVGGAITDVNHHGHTSSVCGHHRRAETGCTSRSAVPMARL